MRKKAALTVAAAAMVGTLAVGGTLAWFTDVEVATNVITTGNVDIALTENGTVPEGSGWKGGQEDPDNENNLIYEGLVPGDTIAKDVDITLAEGSNDAYVRAKVTIGGTLAPLVINGAITFYDEDNGPVDFDAAADGVDGSAWVRNDDGTYTATLTRTDRLTQDDNNMPVFDHISLDGARIGNDYESYDLDNPENGLEIEVVAEAIQADNIGSYAEAWGDVDAPDSQIDIDATKSSNEVGTTVTAAE